MASKDNVGQHPYDRESDSPKEHVRPLEGRPEPSPPRSDDIVTLQNLTLQPDAETATSSRSPTINIVTASYLPTAYPPSTKPLSELGPISISSLEPDTHHRGRKTTVRVLVVPYREHAVSIAVAVEDEQGDTLLLRLFFQLLEQLVPADEILRKGDVVVVREPFLCKAAADDGAYTLRVDHPGDITRLADGDERIPARWRRCVEEEIPSGVLRGQGNEVVQEEQWAKAHRLYTSAIRAAATPEDQQMAYLNRSLANLRLGRPAAALSDAQAAASDNDKYSPGLAEKVLFRTARAQYELGNFPSCLSTLERLAASYPDNPATTHEIGQTKTRIHEQETGTYFFRGMYAQATAAPAAVVGSSASRCPPLIDCATFSSRVAVRPSASPGRGNGLFTTGPVAAGDLLLVEKAFGYGYAPEGTPGAGSMLLDAAAGRGFVGGQVALLARLVDKISHDPEARRVLYELYAGGHEVPGVQELDGGQAVVDSFLVAKIISINAFGAPISSRDALARRINPDPPSPLPSNTTTATATATATANANAFASSALWPLASRINHSCHGNCRRSFIGDVQIVRAARDMPAPGGTELLFGYRSAQHGESHADVQAQLRRHWGFECGCELCAVRKVTTDAMLEKRKVLMGQLHDVLLGEDREGGTERGRRRRKMDVDAAQRILREMETDTYPSSSTAADTMTGAESGGGSNSGGAGPVMRLELWDPYFALGAEMLGRGESEGCIAMILRGLESLGFVIINEVTVTAAAAATTIPTSTTVTVPSEHVEHGTGNNGVADKKKKKAKNSKKKKKQKKNINNNDSTPASIVTTTATAPPTAAPALEITTWGYVTDLVPLALLQLSAAYASLAVAAAGAAVSPEKTRMSRCSEAARAYARTAYSILVGEAETFGDDDFARFGA